MSESKPIGGRICTVPFFVCLLFVLIGFYYLGQRFLHGIGAVSNLSDGYPWGIWIAYDVVVGTAFACGGYAMAILVYICNRGQYHPLVRPALLASVFGYTLAGFSVFFDIGRYWQMYNVFLPWYINTNSVLLEVALCVAIYTMVLWIEFAPAILEKWGLHFLKTNLDKVLFVFIALGILLPTMHQSSLGSVMIIAGSKLSPLWWTGMLPLLYLISAVTMGYAAVIFEASFSSVGFSRPGETKILTKISAIIPWLITAFLVIRFADLTMRGQLGRAFSGDLLGNLFLLENLLLVIPCAMLASPKPRQCPQALFLASVLLMASGGLYRFNCYIVGFNPGDGWQYFPSAPEIFITLGVVALEFLLYSLFVKKLPVLPTAHTHA